MSHLCCPCRTLQDVRGDIFAFGLCMLELLTLKQLDPQHCMEVPQLLTQVTDEEAYRFIENCVGDTTQRHTASQLLEDPFLQVGCISALFRGMFWVFRSCWQDQIVESPSEKSGRYMVLLTAAS